MFFFRSKKRHLKAAPIADNRRAESHPRSFLKGPPEKTTKEKIAASLFDGAERYNCAQAILITFQSRFSVQAADILSAKTMGYGRVSGGLCGALYAGKHLLKDQIKSEQLTHDFESKAGSTRCKKILRLKLISCKGCVALTARLLEKLP